MALRGQRDRHRRHDRGDERLVDIGAHAGHVAHVVTHVVGDATGIAGIILGNAFDDLAGDVGTHVGGLGVDATADAREERDRGRADGEAMQNGRKMRILGEYVVEAAQPEQRRRGHEEPHDRAPIERRQQSVRLRTLPGGLTRTHVGVGRGLHADEAGEERQEGAEQEAAAGDQSRPLAAEGEEEEGEYADRVDEEHLVLANQERHRALADVPTDHVHGLGPFRERFHPEVEEHGDGQAHDARGQRAERQLSNKVTHRRFHPIRCKAGSTPASPRPAIQSDPICTEANARWGASHSSRRRRVPVPIRRGRPRSRTFDRKRGKGARRARPWAGWVRARPVGSDSPGPRQANHPSDRVFACATRRLPEGCSPQRRSGRPPAPWGVVRGRRESKWASARGRAARPPRPRTRGPRPRSAPSRASAGNSGGCPRGRPC